jgi:hypothetical protein
LGPPPGRRSRLPGIKVGRRHSRKPRRIVFRLRPVT